MQGLSDGGEDCLWQRKAGTLIWDQIQIHLSMCSMHRVVERCLIGVRTLSEPQKFDMIFLNSMLLMFWNSISYLSPFVDDFLRQYYWYGSSHILERWRHHDRFVIMPATTYGKVGCGVGLAHCYITIFLKSSGYRNIDDQHRNTNINTREIIWLGNQLRKFGPN